MSKTIKEQWESFEAALLQEAPPIQRQEMRRAFYAGAQAFLGIMTGHLSETEDPDEITDEDLNLLDNLSEELEKFGNDVLEGRA
jgi:hypothetical protein